MFSLALPPLTLLDLWKEWFFSYIMYYVLFRCREVDGKVGWYFHFVHMQIFDISEYIPFGRWMCSPLISLIYLSFREGYLCHFVFVFWTKECCMCIVKGMKQQSYLRNLAGCGWYVQSGLLRFGVTAISIVVKLQSSRVYRFIDHAFGASSFVCKM